MPGRTPTCAWRRNSPAGDGRHPSLTLVRPRFLVWAPLLALTAPLMRIPPLTGLLWRAVQQAAGIADLQLPVSMRDWHIYTIDWQCERVRFICRWPLA